MSLGKLVKDRRRATIDPMTQRPYTQQGLADALKITRSALKAIENGATETIDAAKANRLAELLDDVSVTELVVEMGYEIDRSALNTTQQEMVRLMRRVSGKAQRGMLSIAREAAAVALETQLQAETPRRRQAVE